MATPASPEFSTFLSCLIVDIEKLQAALPPFGGLDDNLNSMTAVVSKSLGDYKEFLLLKCFQCKDSKEAKRITEIGNQHIKEITESIEKCAQEVIIDWSKIRYQTEKLGKDIQFFEEVLNHKQQIDEHKFPDLLGQDWSNYEYSCLLRNGEEWSLQHLVQYLEQDNSAAIDLLFDYVNDPSIFYAYREKPWMVDTVRKYVSSPTEEVRGYRIIATIMSLGPAENLKNLLIEKLAEGRGYALEVTNDLILRHFDNNTWIELQFIDGVKNETGWACLLLYRFLKYSDGVKALAFCKRLWENLGHIFEAQKMLLCITALIDENHAVVFETKKLINTHQFSNRYYRTGNELYHCSERLRIEAEYLLYAGLKAKQTEPYSTEFRFKMLVKILEREMCFIDLIDKRKPFKNVENPATSDIFPKVNQVVMSESDTRVGQADDINPFVLEMAQHLQAQDVNLICYNPNAASIRSPLPNLRFIAGEKEPSFWVRDSFVSCKTSPRIPHLAHFSIHEVTDFLKIKRLARLVDLIGSEEEAKLLSYGCLGTVMHQNDQIRIANFFMHQQAAADPSFIMMTHNEGGNILFGERGGERYAIVGKDTIAMNKFVFSDDLENLGYIREGVNFVKSDVSKSPPMEVTDQEVIEFLAYDHGILPQNIFPVENLNFHIDMDLSLIDDNTVLLNDSMMGVEMWQEFASQQIKDPQFKYNKEQYKARLANFIQRSKAQKKIQDLVESQLKEKGFEVVRMGGNVENLFADKPKNFRINLFNILSLQNPDGKRLILALDSPPLFKDRFEKVVRQHSKVDEFIYLSDRNSRGLLSNDGGLHCALRPVEYEC